eukprot:GHVT01038256.1.p1 GENE.GHVT01038256.1~~GHVT01038256.1.p1  ORF type:complete len:894 (-),score=235.97 GHVT01038256.1:229-2637(-)
MAAAAARESPADCSGDQAAALGDPPPNSTKPLTPPTDALAAQPSPDLCDSSSSSLQAATSSAASFRLAWQRHFQGVSSTSFSCLASPFGRNVPGLPSDASAAPPYAPPLFSGLLLGQCLSRRAPSSSSSSTSSSSSSSVGEEGLAGEEGELTVEAGGARSLMDVEDLLAGSSTVGVAGPSSVPAVAAGTAGAVSAETARPKERARAASCPSLSLARESPCTAALLFPSSPGDKSTCASSTGPFSHVGATEPPTPTAKLPEEAAERPPPTAKDGEEAAAEVGQPESPLAVAALDAPPRKSLEQLLRLKKETLLTYLEAEKLFKAVKYFRHFDQELENLIEKLLAQPDSRASRYCLRLVDENHAGLHRLWTDHHMSTKIGVAHALLDCFHLDHLKGVCEDPRLSFVESLSGYHVDNDATFEATCATLKRRNSTAQSTPDHDPRNHTDDEHHSHSSSSKSPETPEHLHQQQGEHHPHSTRLPSFLHMPSRRTSNPMPSNNDPHADGLHPRSPSWRLSSKMFKTTFMKLHVPRKMSMTLHVRGAGSRLMSMHRPGKPKTLSDEGWTREKDKFLDIWYRIEANHSVSVKVRGKLPCRLFEVLCILNETDLAAHWAPMFSAGEQLKQFSKATKLVRQVFDYPVLGQKESIMFALGVNALEECGCVMIFGRSPPEDSTSFMGEPLPPIKAKPSRIQSTDLAFLLYPISEGKTTTLELYGNFVHGMRFIPVRVVTFLVKKIVRSMYVDIAKLAQKFDQSPYAARVAENPELYAWMEQLITNFVNSEEASDFKHLDDISLASFDFDQMQSG